MFTKTILSTLIENTLNTMNSINIIEQKMMMKREYQEYLDVAREFAKHALYSKTPSVAIQDAHKAVEFALCVYATKKGLAIPRDHWQTKNLAYRISREFGKNFGLLLEFYLGAYRLKNGSKAKKALALMSKMLGELEKHAEEAILPK